MATPTSSSAASGSSETSTDIRAPLWDHVNIVEKAVSGGNTRWQCKYCQHNGFSSYTRVVAHLLQILGKGINPCNKVTFEMLTQMRNEVKRCKELVQRAKTRTVPMPTAPASRDGSSTSTKKNKRGPVSALEKSWALQDRNHLDALIARSFYSGGIPFNFARNPYLREAFAFAANTSMHGYQIPGYNRLREGLLREERAHIDKLLSTTKSTWDQNSSFVHDTVLNELWWSKVEFVLKITTPIHDMIRLADLDTPCLHLIYEMWDSMIEKIKEIYQWEGKEPNEISDLYSVIHEILVARWTKGNNPLHCLAHSLNPRYYSKEWLDEGVGRVPPHKDREVSRMRMTCFKKFFRIPQELAQVKEEYAKFSRCSDEFSSHDAINDRYTATPWAWSSSFGQEAPLLMNLASKLLNQPASSSCCERNWSTYSFIHSVKMNALTPERAEDLVFVHSNLRHLSRRSDAYKQGESRMWDVGGDSFESLSGVGILEVADLSLDEPELQAVSFGDAEVASSVQVIDDDNE